MNVFVSIDFETADAKRDSACAIGLVRVENWRIVYRDSALIRPPRGMHERNRAVHGLSWDDVKDAPSFAEVWAKLSPILTGATRLVAHNVAFDRSVLNACCCLARIEPPKLEWVCTLELARARWPKPAPHTLPDVCRYLGLPFAGHHEAGADADAAARVLIALQGPRPDTPAKPVATVVPLKPGPVVEWVPSGETGKILAEIPAEQRTPAVLNLMRDAEHIGPAHAAALVRAVERWFKRHRPGYHTCGTCSRPRTWMCGLCTACIKALSEAA